MVCVVAALVAVGTWAYFVDIETSEDNTFTAGSLDLKVNGMDDPDVETFFTIECVKPGDMGSATMTLTNEGCCVPAIADIHIKNLVDNENDIKEPEEVLNDTGPVGELSQNMWLTMTAYDAGGAQQWYQEGWLDILHCQNFFIGPLNPDDVVTVVITWEVPGATGNIIMTDSVEFDIEFSLHQAIGEPANMSLSNLVQPETAIVCEPIDISVDVTNNGDVTGSATVTLEIDGWSQSKTVTVEGHATVTVTFSWHPQAPGTGLVAVASIPDDGDPGPHVLECPWPIDVFTPPEVVFEGWEPDMPTTVYVCEEYVIGLILHNWGDVSVTVDVTLTITVDGVEKYSQPAVGGPVTLDKCVPVFVEFPLWHVEDPLTMTGELVVEVDGVPVHTETITIIDNEPTVTNINPPTSTDIDIGDPVTITADADDDGEVVTVTYSIDGGAAQPMSLISGDPQSGTYESDTDWDTTGLPAGNYDITVEAEDAVGQVGSDTVTVHLVGPIADLSNLVVPSAPIYACEEYTISVDVHNSGVAGTVSVTVTVDGWSSTQTVTLANCETVTLNFAWHPTDPGTVTISVGELSADVTVVEMPDEWVKPYSTIGGTTIMLMCMNDADPEGPPAPTSQSWSDHVISTTITTPGYREVVVPQASFESVPTMAYSEDLSAWTVMHQVMASDGYGELWVVDGVGDVDVTSTTDELGTVYTGVRTFTDPLNGTSIQVGDGTPDPAGSMLLHSVVEVQTWTWDGGGPLDTPPAYPGPDWTLAMTITMDGYATTAHSYNHVTEAAEPLFCNVLEGDGAPFGETGGPSPYVGTVGTLVSSAAILDLELVPGMFYIDVQFMAEQIRAPWELLNLTVTPSPFAVLGETIEVSVDVHRIDSLPGPIPVTLVILDAVTGDPVMAPETLWTDVLDVCETETVHFTSFTPSYAGNYIVVVGSLYQILPVMNNPMLTPSLPFILQVPPGTVDIDVTVNDVPLGGGGQYTIVLTVVDSMLNPVFYGMQTVTVPPGGSHVETFTTPALGPGVYTAMVLDPVTGIPIPTVTCTIIVQ
jgi:predicted ribosomally synthesized peptide with SipW-like signal peptide